MNQAETLDDVLKRILRDGGDSFEHRGELIPILIVSIGVFCWDKDELFVLCLEAKKRGRWQTTCPSGWKKPEESSMATMAREFNEETGLVDLEREVDGIRLRDFLLTALDENRISWNLANKYATDEAREAFQLWVRVLIAKKDSLPGGIFESFPFSPTSSFLGNPASRSSEETRAVSWRPLHEYNRNARSRSFGFDKTAANADAWTEMHLLEQIDITKAALEYYTTAQARPQRGSQHQALPQRSARPVIAGGGYTAVGHTASTNFGGPRTLTEGRERTSREHVDSSSAW